MLAVEVETLAISPAGIAQALNKLRVRARGIGVP